MCDVQMYWFHLKCLRTLKEIRGMISNPVCNLCGFADFKTLQTQRDADVYLGLVGIDESSMVREWRKCVSCGHIYNSAQFDSTEIKKLYDEFRNQEWRKESPDEYFDRITAMPAAASENSQKMSLLQRVVGSEKLSQGGAAIDIGCGGGVLLHTAKKALGAGWSFYGVEPTPSFAELGSRRTGAAVINGNYRAGLFADIKFDLAMCCQVLEHLDRPSEFVGEIRSDLRGEGLLYLEVPDISDFQTLPEDHDRFMVQHISYFSQPTLEKLLTRSNFKILDSGVSTTVRGRNNLWFMAQAA